MVRLGKVLCKKKINKRFKEGEFYEVTYITPDNNYIFVAYGDEDFDYKTFHRIADIPINIDSEYFYDNENQKVIFIFKNYFIDIAEMRKQKLNKIYHLDGV